MKKPTKNKGHGGNGRRKNPDGGNGSKKRMDDFQVWVENDVILTTKEACSYLRISRPTYLKYITAGKIKAQKIGNAWKVFKTDLDRLVREG